MNRTSSRDIRSRVCALSVSSSVPESTIECAIDNILNFRAYRLLRIFAREEVVAVKPCLSQTGSSLPYVASVVHLLSKRGVTPMVCDTTDRYRDVRRNAVKRLEELAGHIERPATPIVILDGIKGEHEVLIRGEGKRRDAHLAGELPSLGGAVIVSCVEADALTGLSGVVVNLGVGLASKRGKIMHFAMHTPRVRKEKCYNCRRCLRQCPVGAIRMAESHVMIDAARCINCGRCVEVARFGGIAYDWDATPEHFADVVTTHARAALDVLRHRVVCLSVVQSASTSDDGQQATLLFSRDPVAIDTAALELMVGQGGLTEVQQRQAESLLAKAEAVGLGRRQHVVESVAF